MKKHQNVYNYAILDAYFKIHVLKFKLLCRLILHHYGNIPFIKPLLSNQFSCHVGTENGRKP